MTAVVSAAPDRGTHLLIVGDFLHSGLHRILGKDSADWLNAMTVVRTGRQSLRTAGETQPDVALVELELPDASGLSVIEGLRRRSPGTKTIVAAAKWSPQVWNAATSNEVQGLVNRDLDPEDLLDVVRRVANGERYFDCTLPRVTNRPNEAIPCGLTKREVDILRRVALGETNAEIAAVLGLSQNTVKTYVQRALEKLGVRNRVRALTEATRLGIL